MSGQSSRMEDQVRKGGSPRTRRELLGVLGTVLPVGAVLARARNAYGLSREEMPAEIAKLYRGHCAADPVHAPTLEAAFARLDAAGIKYDRAEIAATLRCPICGCSIISSAEPPGGTSQGPSAF
jgi:Fe-S oxidoreductase